jgi:hypothetical protein
MQPCFTRGKIRKREALAHHSIGTSPVIATPLPFPHHTRDSHPFSLCPLVCRTVRLRPESFLSRCRLRSISRESRPQPVGCHLRVGLLGAASAPRNRSFSCLPSPVSQQFRKSPDSSVPRSHLTRQNAGKPSAEELLAHGRTPSAPSVAARTDHVGPRRQTGRLIRSGLLPDIGSSYPIGRRMQEDSMLRHPADRAERSGQAPIRRRQLRAGDRREVCVSGQEEPRVNAPSGPRAARGSGERSSGHAPRSRC